MFGIDYLYNWPRRWYFHFNPNKKRKLIYVLNNFFIRQLYKRTKVNLISYYIIAKPLINITQTTRRNVIYAAI